MAAAFALSYRGQFDRHRPGCRTWRLFHTGVHTEYAGTGRVRFVSFFRGAGYVVVLRSGRGRDGRPLAEPGWRPNIEIPGFTILVRTAKSSRRASYGTPVRHVRITRNPNQPAC
ncbi:MAG TPA: hypothetical protein VMZ53_03620 [Kofleriaceae bacterium]|nr:hypothetical protein [Kofleriaceae bacterium]